MSPSSGIGMQVAPHLGMTTGKQSTLSVVVATDFSESAQHALNTALALVARQPDITLHVVSVAPDPPFPENFASQREVDQYLRAEASLSAKLHEHVVDLRERFERAHRRPTGKIACHARFGDAAREIVTLAAAVNADIILVGTHSRQGIDRVLLGSVAEKIVRTAGCAVQVVRPKDHPPIEDPLEEVEPPPRKGQGSQLGKRHTYHYVPRSVVGGNMPLVYHDPIPTN
jgi:nucleotide-binding universal stress UspA family protein